ncbi:MAG: SDR family NAD(P)-dependent oxidoreductase [Deltaproteobacteria bacterium]|nr:SDR family NAD(P)-dependent oxidoreductase [Deltaproteobacteria bacterium]
MEKRRVFIVTGASRGIGAAVACWLGKVGAGVTLVSRSGAELGKVASQVDRLGGNALVVQGDVTDPSVSDRAVERSLERFQRIDGIINNAGVVEPLAVVAKADPWEWRRCVEVNLLGPFFLSRCAMPELRRNRGRIVNVSSGAATHAIFAASAYCSAKAALNHFTQVMAREEPFVVSVAVRPGVVDTAMQTVLRQKGASAMPEEHWAYYADLKKKGQLEPPSVPARSIAWLALHAPPAWSGAFLSYDDPEIFAEALRELGEDGSGVFP